MSSFREYNPSNPQRARGISKQQWEKFKPKISHWHRAGSTKPQILDFLKVDTLAMKECFHPSYDNQWTHFC